jgi:hypothetical protein
MKNPTVKQVNFVIKKLQSVEKQANEEGAFDMRVCDVYDKKDEYECGTVHCVAGWYAVANLDHGAIKTEMKKGYVGYTTGADLLAYDLGLNNLDGLCNWAKYNPEIWGNKNGFDMFANENAYDNEGFDGVIAQFETVRDNLPEAV